MPVRDHSYYQSTFKISFFSYSFCYIFYLTCGHLLNPLTTLQITIAFPYQTHCTLMILHIQRHIDAFLLPALTLVRSLIKFVQVSQVTQVKSAQPELHEGTSLHMLLLAAPE
jgi:hypothetical protein